MYFIIHFFEVLCLQLSTPTFGAFEVNLRVGELRKHGLRLKLQDQPLRILTLLVKNAGEPVSREQIQANLWASNTHVDYENAINSAVRKLRDALGDTAENPRFIETLSRRGYRFIAPVAWKPAPDFLMPCPPAVPAGEPGPAAAANARRRLLAIPLALVAAAVMLIAWAGYGNRRTVQLRAPVPLTSYPGIACCPSFSPDGSRVAFSWNGHRQDNFDKGLCA
jgi:DNA-binding winged helix-turn-helix (wHTH) protein